MNAKCPSCSSVPIIAPVKKTEPGQEPYPNVVSLHSSKIRGLRSMKCSSKTLQNLLYFMYKKTHVVFFRFSFCATLLYPFVDIDQGIYKGKSKVARNEKRKKTTLVFLHIKYSRF